MADPIYVPLNQPSDAVVLELVNRSNPDITTPLTLSQVFFQNVRPGEEIGSNTTVDVVADDDFSYPGIVPVHYNRLDLSRFAPGGMRQLDGYYFNSTQLLEEFNATFDLRITPAEVVSTVIDDDDVILLTISNSLAYLPDTTLAIREGYMDHVSFLDELTTVGLFNAVNVPPITPSP